MVGGMIDKLFAMVKPDAVSDESEGLLRLPRLTYRGEIDCVMFSGGVSEFIYNRTKTDFGDLGPLIAEEVHRRIGELGLLVMEPNARIRATVIGASQYTVQVSGNTVFISPVEAVPVRNIAVVAPEFPLNQDEFTKDAVRDAALTALRRLDLLTRAPTRCGGLSLGRFGDFFSPPSILRRYRRRPKGHFGQRPSVGIRQ